MPETSNEHIIRLELYGLVMGQMLMSFFSCRLLYELRKTPFYGGDRMGDPSGEQVHPEAIHLTGFRFIAMYACMLTQLISVPRSW